MKNLAKQTIEWIVYLVGDRWDCEIARFDDRAAAHAWMTKHFASDKAYIVRHCGA